MRWSETLCTAVCEWRTAKWQVGTVHAHAHHRPVTTDDYEAKDAPEI